MNARAYTQFKKHSLAVTSDLEAVVLLYTEAIDLLNKAKESFAEKNSEYKSNIAHAQKIILGMRSILNYKEGGEMARNLAELYSYFNARLTVASYGVRQAPEIIAEITGLLVKLKESWENIVPKNKPPEQPAHASGKRDKLDFNV